MKSWQQIIHQMAKKFRDADIPYHFDGSTTAFLIGIDFELDDIDITVQWDYFHQSRVFFKEFNPSNIVEESTPNYHFFIDEKKVHILSSTKNFLFYLDPERHIIKYKKQKIWSKNLNFYRRHISDNHKLAKLIDEHFAT